MKKKITEGVLLIIIIFNCLFLVNPIKAQIINNKKNYFTSFSVKLLSTSLLDDYSLFISVTNNQIKITYKSYSFKIKDTILLLRNLQASDSIQNIGKMNINKLKKEYSNPCIDDGLQYNVIIKKENIIKSVEIYNYYQDEIGKIIYLVNSLLPKKFKIWYDKEKLIADYNRCKTETNADKLDSLNKK